MNTIWYLGLFFSKNKRAYYLKIYVDAYPPDVFFFSYFHESEAMYRSRKNETSPIILWGMTSFFVKLRDFWMKSGRPPPGFVVSKLKAVFLPCEENSFQLSHVLLLAIGD